MSFERLNELHQKVTAACRHAVEKGMDLGADRVKVVGSVHISSRIVVENGDFSLVNTNTGQGLGVLVHKDQKKGSASTNNLDQLVISSVLKDALALASFSLPDEHLIMATKDQVKGGTKLHGLLQEEVANLSLDDIGSFMRLGLDAFKKSKKFALERFEFSLDLSSHILVNSLGVDLSEQQGTIGWDYLGMAHEGEQVSGMDYDGGFSFQLKGIKERLEKEICAFTERVEKTLNPIHCPGFKGPILITPRALGDLILSPILYHASGRTVMDGKSRYEHSLGEEVVSPMLSFYDHPHDLSLKGATAYDGDGLPTRSLSIVTDGVLKAHMLDLYSAHKLGKTPNHCSGGPFCLHQGPGQMNLEDLKKMPEKMLVVHRFSGSSNPLNGDFSGVAKGARYYKNGVDQGPVGETMIAGNSFDLLKQIQGVSCEREAIFGSSLLAHVLADGVTVS